MTKREEINPGRVKDIKNSVWAKIKSRRCRPGSPQNIARILFQPDATPADFLDDSRLEHLIESKGIYTFADLAAKSPAEIRRYQSESGINRSRVDKLLALRQRYLSQS